MKPDNKKIEVVILREFNETPMSKETIEAFKSVYDDTTDNPPSRPNDLNNVQPNPSRQSEVHGKSDEAINPGSRACDVIWSAFLMPIRWLEKIFCKHKKTTEIFRSYQDRYVSELCNDCGKVLYMDL